MMKNSESVMKVLQFSSLLGVSGLAIKIMLKIILHVKFISLFFWRMGAFRRVGEARTLPPICACEQRIGTDCWQVFHSEICISKE